MLELPDLFNVLQSVASLKSVARFLTLFCFGLVVIMLAYPRTKKISDGHGIFIKTLWILALADLALYGGLEWALPMSSQATQLVTGFCFVLGAATLAVGQNSRKDAFSKEGRSLFILFSVAGSIIFLCFSLTVFLEYALQGRGAPPGINHNILFHSWSLLGVQGKIILGLHLVMALVAVGILILSSCVAALYLWLYKNLKKKSSPYEILSLPSLGRLETIATRLSFVGLLFMTASLLSGMWLVFIEFPLTITLLTKVLWAFLVWGWFIITLFAKDILGLYGKRGAWFYILGGTFLLLGFLALSFFE